jgi:hypothetical protein
LMISLELHFCFKISCAASLFSRSPVKS